MAQKRKKTKFNLIDVLIVMIMLAVIAVTLYLLFGGFSNFSGSDKKDLTFEVRISGVKQGALPLFREGIAVKDSVKNEAIGTIVSVRTEKSRHYGGVVQNENGDYVLSSAESEDEYDVYVTVSASADRNENGIYTVGEDTKLLIGAPVHFKIKSFAATSYIVGTNIPD